MRDDSLGKFRAVFSPAIQRKVRVTVDFWRVFDCACYVGRVAGDDLGRGRRQKFCRVAYVQYDFTSVGFEFGPVPVDVAFGIACCFGAEFNSVDVKFGDFCCKCECDRS